MADISLRVVYDSVNYLSHLFKDIGSSKHAPAVAVVDSSGAQVNPAAPVLAAGSAVIGKVGIDQTTPGTTDSVTIKNKGYTSGVVSVTRPSNTTGYTGNDVLGTGSGAAAAAAALTFPNMGPAAGGEIRITSAIFERDASALIAGETTYTLHLYNVTPPSALLDNDPFDLPSGDRAAYLGSINLGTPVDLGSTLYVATDGINKQITLLSSNLFGYLVTVGPYTPASGAVHRIALHAERL